MQNTRVIPVLISIAFLAAIVGFLAFKETPAPEKPQAPVVENPVTTTDKSSLLKGAGSVDANAPKEFTATTSGLKYRILRQTDGPKPNSSHQVTVNYRGWLDDGTEFDSSYKRGEPTSFPLGKVIAGWTEGLQHVPQGGMIELWIPSSLGYGPAGMGDKIPPGATLHFLVELIEFK
ncbi:MAG: FKBP-type peptidyl-prolyl cis-trans isomerase [Planctomycetaceae bacterium]